MPDNGRSAPSPSQAAGPTDFFFESADVSWIRRSGSIHSSWPGMEKASIQMAVSRDGRGEAEVKRVRFDVLCVIRLTKDSIECCKCRLQTVVVLPDG